MIAKRFVIPGSTDEVELASYKPSAVAANHENLRRLKSTGEVVWVAEMPERTGDAYVDARLEGGSLTAWSWSCYRVVIELATGKITERVFTK